MRSLVDFLPRQKDGRVTAGNSSQINDGAVAVVVMAAEKRPVWAKSRWRGWSAGQRQRGTRHHGDWTRAGRTQGDGQDLFDGC
ncbi:MAG: hypothetical protein ACOX2J_03870 [Bacillota bacterium]